MNSFKLSAMLVLIASLCATLAKADRVTIINGDELSGSISFMDSRQLSISTQYFGTVRIARENISAIHVDRIVQIKLPGNAVFEGTISTRDDGKIVIQHSTDSSSEITNLDHISFFYYFPPIDQKLSASGSIVGEVDIERDEDRTETEEWEVNITSAITYGLGRNRTKFEYEREKEDKQSSEEETLFDTSLDYFISSRIYLTSRFRFENDNSDDLEIRRVYGIGIGHQPWRAPFRRLLYSVEAIYTEDQLESRDDESDHGLEWNLYYQEETALPNLYLLHDHQIQRLEDNRVRIETQSSLRYVLAYNIGLQIGYEWDYTEEPDANNRKTYSNMTLGVSYSW